MDATTIVRDSESRTESSPHSIASSKRSLWVELTILAVLAVAMRLPWIFMIPISQAPDEGAHYWVLDFIHKNLRLPELSDMVKHADSAYYGALSPFSYIPHLLCAWAMPFVNAPFAYRFGSLIMGVVSVLASYGVGRQLFPKSKLVALAVPIYLIFHPQLAFVNGYSNNDSASMAIATLVIYASLVAVKRGISSKLAVAIGLLGGCLALSKPTTYCMFPVLLAAVVAAFCFHRENVRSVLKKFAIMGSLSAALAVPFFARNWMAFNGDLLGMKTMLDLWWSHWGKPAQLYKWPVVDNADWRYCAFLSYVGNLGNMDRLLPSRIYKLFSLGVAIATGGWTVGFVLSWLKGKSLDAANNRSIEIAMWLLIASAFVFNFAALVAASSSLNATGPPQGRYLFPSEVCIAALIFGGLSRFGRVGQVAVILFTTLMVAAGVISLCMLYPVWHFDVNIFR